MITGVYYGLTIKKPFNPYLGETLQGTYSDGSQLFVEHIRHDPYLDAFYIVNDKLGFKVYGHYQFKSKMNSTGNELSLIFDGIFTVEIHGHKIHC